MQKRGETTLRQQHGPGKTIKVHTGDLLHPLDNLAQLVLQHGVGKCIDNLVFGRLQVTTGFTAGTVLTPVTTVAPLGGFETDFGKTFAGLARKYFVTAFADVFQARGLAVQRQADGIQDRAFAGSGRPGDGKNAIGAIRRMGKIDQPFARQ